jgi:phage terminase small subunit
MGKAARNKETGLTDKEDKFCELIAYDPDLNDSDAYRGAYNCERMKATTINRKANDLKNKDHIRARIKQLREERAERTKVDADWLLTRLALEATADLADLFCEDGELLPVSQWPKIWRQGLVSGVDNEQLYEYEDGKKVPAGVVKKIRLSDRVKRLEMIGKHIDVQAFKERVEHDHGVVRVMPVPTVDSVDGWEEYAQKQQQG